MIDQSAFELCASQLSATACPDCGRQHEVSLKFEEEALLWSVDESAKNCTGFKDLVNRRLSTCRSLDPNPKAEFLLRRFLGDPSL